MTHQDNHQNKEIDSVTGVETTGHEWDGLKELNNPLPRWWLWIFLATVIWSIGYFIVYPSWPIPGGATKGTSGYTQYNELKASQQKIVERQQAYLDKLQGASFDDVMKDPTLYNFSLAGGEAAFKSNCATCHGSGAQGGKGFPNLNDDDWLWGGTIDDIYTTIRHGIRSPLDEDTRISQMPAFGKDGILTRDQINAVVAYVQNISGTKKSTDVSAGEAVFQENCAACHGEGGIGNRELGAPRLNDKIWLYGEDQATLFQTVYNARAGVMPAWQKKLDDNTIRQLTIYVHELGGGEATPVEAPPVTDSIPSEAQPESSNQPQTQGE